jgi:hypothetical protein
MSRPKPHNMPADEFGDVDGKDREKDVAAFPRHGHSH